MKEGDYSDKGYKAGCKAEPSLYIDIKVTGFIK